MTVFKIHQLDWQRVFWDGGGLQVSSQREAEIFDAINGGQVQAGLDLFTKLWAIVS